MPGFADRELSQPVQVLSVAYGSQGIKSLATYLNPWNFDVRYPRDRTLYVR